MRAMIKFPSLCEVRLDKLSKKIISTRYMIEVKAYWEEVLRAFDEIHTLIEQTEFLCDVNLADDIRALESIMADLERTKEVKIVYIDELKTIWKSLYGKVIDRWTR